MVSGQSLDPSSFGQTDPITGSWVAKKYTGSYGTNGFYLNFSDNSAATSTTIGKDSSGNGNNWTPNNISVTAGTTYDSMLDVPSGNGYADGGNGRGNYATLNPVDNSGVTITNGNLTATTPGSNQACKATMAFPTTGKYYFEVTDVVTGGGNAVGIANVTLPTNTSLYLGTGSIWVGMSSNAVFGLAFNFDALTYTIYKNNSVDSTGSITSGITYAVFMQTSSSGGASTAFNFGQRPFSYTPPTGFKALNTTNLSDPTVKNGAGYMAATLYAGSSSAQSITNTVNGVSFQPDLVWGKNRSNVNSHRLTDSVRGVGKVLFSNDTAGDTTGDGQLASFNSNGWTFTSGAGAGLNESGNNYVAWNWKANGTGVSNTAGTITSTVSANTTSGFSICTFTSGAPGTVGHGLGVAPSMIILKSRNNVSGWSVYHSSVGNTGALNLQTTGGISTSSDWWSNTSPTSSVFSIGANIINGWTWVGYAFAAIPGYSAFGKYTGNGSTDGPFVFCGFRPRFILVKSSSGAFDWHITDTSRSTYNQADTVLFPNSSAAETNGGGYYYDLLSNGFKCRNLGSATNGSGATYIYAAFAENPLKFSNAR